MECPSRLLLRSSYAIFLFQTQFASLKMRRFTFCQLPVKVYAEGNQPEQGHVEKARPVKYVFQISHKPPANSIF